jgi:glycosyltransferase involved in cell wall biosynthesis
MESPLLPEVGLLALPYHHWGTRWQTPHHVLPRLARYFSVVWLEPPHHWREVGQLGQRRRAAREWKPILPASFDHYVPEAWLPELYRPPWLRRMLFHARVCRAWRRLDALGCRARVLHLWHPAFEDALDMDRYDLSLYHIDDEYTFRADAPPVGVQEERVLRKVDQVFATAPLLIERKGGINPHMAFAPHGVDFQLYATPVPEPLDIAPIPHPRVGYVGHLKLQLDWALLRDLARRHPQWSFVFVGPRKPMLPEQEVIVDDMASLPNVHLLGAKPVTELAAYPQHFDVCMMPYVVNGYTNNVFPLKLNEYLASGKPVIGTPIHTLMDFTNVVTLAADVNGWSVAIASALEPEQALPAMVAARHDVARQHDWNEIIFSIAQTICNRLGPSFAEKVRRLDTCQAISRQPTTT